MANAKILRVVAASPNDVQQERDVLDNVVAEVNRGVAADRGIRLEVTRWETDAYPGFHPEGAQGLIDPVLRITDCDLLIGIFWKRFGTPTSDAESGTEHEIQVAHDAWKRSGAPQVMVYFNERSAAPSSSAELDQWAHVLRFKESFPKEGLWWAYKGHAQFEKLIRNHLTQYIRDHFSLLRDAPEQGTSADSRARIRPERLIRARQPGEVPGESRTSVFLAYAYEDEIVAYALQDAVRSYANTKEDCEIRFVPWQQASEMGESILQNLLSKMEECDFGIFLLTPPHRVKNGDSEWLMARDNVVFEAGLFIGMKGSPYTFILLPDEYLVAPSGLQGMIGIKYSYDQINNAETHYARKSAIGSACVRIVDRIQFVMAQRQP